MALIGSCCGRAPAVAGRLPPRVPPKMAEDIIKNTQLSSKEIQGLYDRFRKYAPSGRLLFSRFCDTLGVLGMLDDTMIAERMFRAFDRNRDRELSFTEFATALGIMMRGTDDQKLDLSFRILNPNYTGTGECLDDYRCNLATRSESGEEIPRSPSRRALSEPGTSDIDSPDRVGEGSFGFGWGRATAENEARKEAASGESGVLSEKKEGPVMSCSRLVLYLPGDMRWFEMNREVIYADSIGLDEFLDLVRCLQASRRALLGGEGIVASDDEIATVFLPLTSEMPDGSRRMMLKDFKLAVRNSPRFLCVLGVVSTHVSSPSVHSGKRTDRKASLVSSACTGASFGLVGASPRAAGIRASVQAELLRRIRQAEAKAEMQQRKQQQQHRQQLERLAAGLREVEKDVKAVEKALAGCQIAVPPDAHNGAASCLQSTGCRTTWRRHVSSPVADCEVKFVDFWRCTPADSRASEMEGDPPSNGTAPTTAHCGSVKSCAVSKAAAPAPTGATAATVAAAAAVAALQQAEQQLNRILEESSLAAYPSFHIVEQFMMAMGSSCCLDSPQQGPSREGPLLHELPHQQKPVVRPVRRQFAGRSAEVEGDSATAASFAGIPEGDRQHKVGQHKVCFRVGQHCHDLQGTSPARNAVLDLSWVGGLWRSCSQRRTQVAFARRMYMNRAKMYRTTVVMGRGYQGFFGGLRCRDGSRALGKDAKGLVVHFGHESWNMVINIMVGIRLAGGRAMSEPHRAVEPYDFVMKEKFSVLPKTGMVDKRQASLCAVRFIDYAPMVFRRIRAIFGIDSLSYIRSVGPEQLLGNLILGNLSSLSELVSEGKSGSLFYYTTDGRFMIKTVSKETAKFMRSILFDYYKHVSTCTNTMLTRFCGLHAIRLKDKSGQIRGHKEPCRRKTYFMVMENFFHTPVEIHRRYDLKGSTKGRSLPRELLGDSTVARKDNDMTPNGYEERLMRCSTVSCAWCFKIEIDVGGERKKLFIDQLSLDATFLRDHGIMDYSLLVGISYASQSEDSNICQNGVFQFNEDINKSRSMSVRVLLPLGSSLASVSVTGTEFERPFWSKDLGGMQSSDRTKLYYVGIIDILTHWNAKKKLEHVARVLQ
ncbi:hypothetical protein Efla_003449 [Eimeria flavescens]